MQLKWVLEEVQYNLVVNEAWVTINGILIDNTGICLIGVFVIKPVLCALLRYGFRRPPYLELKARPKLGEREVTLVHVTDWIERKLEQEFQVRFLNSIFT